MNPAQDKPTKSGINKAILELKKKIQLSDGQRKALFEDYEMRRKENADEILRLKKENSQLALALHECQNGWMKNTSTVKRLTLIVGPLERKKYYEVQELVDLQIINQTKKVDLYRYRIKQKQSYLADLAGEYQELLSKRALREVKEKIDNPVKKATSELQNNILAVQLQQREANHVKIRYKDIKKSLLEDAARFESKIKELEEEIQLQNAEIERMQQIHTEAIRLKSAARSVLLQEERAALSSSRAREREASEGRRLVEEHRRQLENLERRLFQVGRTAADAKNQDDEPTEPDGTAVCDQQDNENEEEEERVKDPKETLLEGFAGLRRVTGATGVEDVLERFRAQKETLERLVALKRTTEEEKGRMEARRAALAAELEGMKFTEAKETSQNKLQVEKMKKQIEEERIGYEKNKEQIENTKEMKVSVVNSLKTLHVSIDSNCNFEGIDIIEHTKQHIKDLVEKVTLEKQLKENGEPSDEDNWLPPPYSSLVRRTPLPQAGVSPVPQTGSEEEEEVPSRVFLKRQAQLVVDAKTRRKNLRISMPQRQ